MKTSRTSCRPSQRAGSFQSLEKNGSKISNHWKLAAGVAAMLLGIALRASAVVLASETFDSNDAGWSSRDPLEMTVDFSSSVGDPSGSLHGSFASQDVPSFESDAFRVTSSSSGGDFTGNLYLSYTNFSAVTFAFYAEDALPSTFIIRIGNGTSTFLYNLSPQLVSPATWTTVNVSLAYSAGWIGGSASQFSNLFSSVTFMDVQIGRNGTGAQDYFLDNFSLSYALNQALASVPEPASIGLILMGLFGLYVARKRRNAKALAVRDENH